MNGGSIISVLLILFILTSPIWITICYIIKIKNKIQKRKEEKRKLQLLEEINKKLNNNESVEIEK